eukprot:1150431-Pelagomonas_calceolata.AAC.5
MGYCNKSWASMMRGDCHDNRGSVGACATILITALMQEMEISSTVLEEQERAVNKELLAEGAAFKHRQPL